MTTTTSADASLDVLTISTQRQAAEDRRHGGDLQPHGEENENAAACDLQEGGAPAETQCWD